MNQRGRWILALLLIAAPATLARAGGKEPAAGTAVGAPNSAVQVDQPRSRPAMPPAGPGKPYSPPNKGGGGQPPTTQQTTCNGGMGQATGADCSCRGVDLSKYFCKDMTVTSVNGLTSSSPMHACVCND